jgi:hypothetical protein
MTHSQHLPYQFMGQWAATDVTTEEQKAMGGKWSFGSSQNSLGAQVYGGTTLANNTFGGMGGINGIGGITSNGIYPGQYGWYTTPQGNYGNIQYPYNPNQPSPLPPEQYQAKPITDLPEETMVAAIVAWRAWQVSPFTDELKSFNGTLWTPYEWLKAKCAATTCAGLNCSCGIYSMRESKYLDAEGYSVVDITKFQRIYGEVYLKGHILQCKKGYRSSHAYPKSFVDTGALARRMAITFGVPLIDGKPERK